MAKTPLEIMSVYYDKLLTKQPDAKDFVFGVWADHCILTFPGNHPFSGTFHAKSWQPDVYKAALKAKGVVDAKVKCFELAADDKFAVSHYLEIFEFPGGEKLEAERFCIYGFENERVISMRVIDINADAVNEFFNKHFAS